MSKQKTYRMPSQQLLDIINQKAATDKPMTPFDASMLVSLAIVDKLEVIAVTLKAMLPIQMEKKDGNS
jgi:hypothetical protein